MTKEYWDGVDQEAAPDREVVNEAAVMLSRPTLEKVLPEDMKAMTALSLGCDDSEPAIEAARRGARVIVVDPKEEALDTAFKDLARQGLSADLVVASPIDLRSLPAESVDLVTAGSHITVAYELERVFREIHRVLKPRGRLLLILPHPLVSGGRSISGGSGRVQWLLDDYFNPGPDAPAPHMRGSDMAEGPRLRTLEGYVNPLLASGFAIERVLEPKPDPRMKGVSNTAWNIYNRIPQLLIVKAVRVD